MVPSFSRSGHLPVVNTIISTGTVPWQWKQAIIRPVPATPTPTKHADRTVVNRFLYPAMLAPPTTLVPRSIQLPADRLYTAALVYTLHTITSLLNSNPLVIVIALDFSKAFDTVRHSSLLHKLAQLDTPGNVYNWLLDFLLGHSHYTEYNGQVSALREISASVTQGSAIGPAMYVVEPAADLHAVTPGNLPSNYADDRPTLLSQPVTPTPGQ